MICPNCLSNNSNSANKCKKCGCPLNDNITNDRQEEQMSAHSAKKHELDANLRFKVKEVYVDNIQYDDLPSEEASSISVSAIRHSETVRRKSAPGTGKRGVYSSQSIKSGKKKRNATMIFTIVLWVLILGALITGICMGINAISGLFNSGFDVTPTPTVSKSAASAPDVALFTDENGIEYINYKFYGLDGDSVNIIYGQKNERLYFEDGVAQINLYLSDFLTSSSLITNSKVPVTLNAIYRYADGSEASINVPTVEYTVIETPITLINTESKAVEVFKDTYTLVFAIPKGSNLYINDVISNDKVDSSGRVEYTVDIKPGDNINVTIRAQAPYQKASEAMFTIYRQKLNTSFTMANSNPKSTENKTIKITGTASKNAIITCDSKYTISNYTLDNRTGVFSMNVTLPSYGVHDILFTVTDSEGKVARLTHTVKYMPNEDSYTRSVWAYDSKIATTPSQFINKSFLFKAKIQEFILAEEKTFLINMGTSESPEYICVEYDGPLTLNTTTEYRIFGDVIGTKDGKALVAARFIYNW